MLPSQVSQTPGQITTDQQQALHAQHYMQQPSMPPMFMQWPTPMGAQMPAQWGTCAYPMGAIPPIAPVELQPLRGEKEDASGRWVLKPEDVVVLEQHFVAAKWPSRQLQAKLALELRVTRRQVQVWFQNKRQRVKTGAKPTIAEVLAHEADPVQAHAQTPGAEAAVVAASMANPSDETDGAAARSVSASTAASHGGTASATAVAASSSSSSSSLQAITLAQAETLAQTAALGVAGCPEAYSDGRTYYLRADLVTLRPRLSSSAPEPAFAAEEEGGDDGGDDDGDSEEEEEEDADEAVAGEEAAEMNGVDATHGSDAAQDGEPDAKRQRGPDGAAMAP